MSDNIIVDWLKSVKLELYIQQFLDNGYDELEVCKQIGEADLDAIGVHNGVHREILLNAVSRLREEGGASVYFTLEEPEDTDPEDDKNENDKEEPQSPRKGSVRLGVQKSPVPVADPPPPPNYEQLRNIINDKLRRDGVDLTGPPYTKQDNACCTSSLAALSVKYAGHLQAHLQDVYKCLEELWVWRTRKAAQLYYSTTVVNTAATKAALAGSSVFNSGAAAPPPIPSSLPPSTSHAQEKSVDLHSVHTRYTYDNSGFQGDTNHEDPDGKDDKKKSSTLSRFFRNLGLRKSAKKHTYKPHNGDPIAHEITMDDEDRMALMLLVKEGKITTAHALEVVKRYEEERRREFIQYEKDRKNYMKKKKKPGKPVKSPSATYNDCARHCDVCQGLVSCDPSHSTSGNVCGDPSHRFECHQHRRVHSVGHIDYAYSPRSPEASRSLSCTPTHFLLSHHGSGLSTPVSFYSPAHHPRLYSPVMPQDGSLYGYSCGSCCHYGRGGMFVPSSASSQGRASRCDMMSPPTPSHFDLSPSGEGVSRSASGCVDHSPSTASFDLVSSESDHSVNCHSPSQQDPRSSRVGSNGGNNYMDSSAISAPFHKDYQSPHQLMQSTWQRGHAATGIYSETPVHKPIKEIVGPSVSASSIDSNHSAESSGLCSYHSASPGVTGSVMDNTCHMNFVRAVTDFQPNPTDRDMLRLQKGDIIRVTNKPPGEVWGGMLKGKTGWFKVACVEPYVTADSSLGTQVRRSDSKRRKPQTVKEILHLIGLEKLEPLFMQNGFDQPDCFLDLEDRDLDLLQIHDPQLRARLLAVGDMMCSTDGFSQKNLIARHHPSTLVNREYRYGNHSYPASQDSGCYASFEHLAHKDTCSNSPVVGSQRENHYCAHSNKENLHPNLQVGVFSTNAGCQGDTCKNLEINNLDRVDKELTAEDQEVCEITRNSVERESVQNSPTHKVQGQSSTESAPAVVMCAYAGTQTSPISGPGCDLAHIQGSNSSSLSNAPLVTKSKPFPCKSVPCASTKDAQVQVMFPILTPNRPESSANRNSVTSQRSSGEYGSVKTSLSDSKSPVGNVKPAPKLSPHGPANADPQGEHLQVSPVTSTNTLGNGRKQPLENPYGNGRKPTMENPYGNGRKPVMENPYGNSRKPIMENPYGNGRKPNENSHYSSASAHVQMGHRSVNRRSRSVDSATHSHSHQSEYKTVMRSLINLVSTKLVTENIDLTMEPYSSKMGECGIPPLLVQRYAEELRQDLVSVALVMDQVRVQHLCARRRAAILSRDLPEAAGKACDIKIGSLPEFLISIGLPMYTDIFLSENYVSIEDMCKLSSEDIRDITHTHNKHVKRIAHALDWVQSRFVSMRKSTSSKDAAMMDRV